VTLAGLATIAFYVVVAMPRSAIPLIDGDVWWHIRAGREVISTGRIPSVDSWSIAGMGMPWTSQDWLSNVAMALTFQMGTWGPTLLSLLFATLAAAALGVLSRGIAIRTPEAGWLSRIVWLAVGLTVAGPVLGVRVQVIDLVLAAAVTLLLWAYLRERDRSSLVWLPVIAVVWANLHAGWVLLFLISGAVVVGEAIDRAVGRQLEPEPLRWEAIGWLVVALVISVGAIAINPNGAELYLYPLETSSIQAHRDFLAEWSPPDLTSLPGQLFLGFVVIGVLPTFVLGWRQVRLADAFLLVGLTVMAATAARFLLVAGPIGAAVVAIVVGPVVGRSSIGRAAGPILDRMARPSRLPRLRWLNLLLAGLLIAIGGAIILVRTSPDAQQTAVADHMPVAAVDWMVAHDVGERPFNTYSWGGYLGFRRPDTLVYIDGRSDIYGDTPIRRYADAISLRADPSQLLAEHDIDHVLFNTDHPFAEWLDDNPAWDREYRDRIASVWVRSGDADE
jgi:hypothetical protein